MAKINGTGLAYRNDVTAEWLDDAAEIISTTRSVYEMWIANRLVFLVSIVNSDPDLRIQLGKPDADVTTQWYISDGNAAKGTHEVPASDGGPVPDGLIEHIDGITLQQYIYPRTAHILTNMYGLGIDES